MPPRLAMFVSFGLMSVINYGFGLAAGCLLAVLAVLIGAAGYLAVVAILRLMSLPVLLEHAPRRIVPLGAEE